MNEEWYAEVRAALAANTKEHESYNRRLHEHDEKLEKQSELLVLLERLTNTVKSLTERMAEMNTSMKVIDGRLVEIEREPGEKWKKVTWEIIKALLLAAVGFVSARAFG